MIIERRGKKVDHHHHHHHLGDIEGILEFQHEFMCVVKQNYGEKVLVQVRHKISRLLRTMIVVSIMVQMARNTTGVDYCPVSPKSVRIVVLGDKGTVKSSLIVAAATDSLPPNVPPVLPNTKLPFEFFPDGVPVTIVDTSSRPEDKDMVAEELKHADSVVLTYACDRPETLERLSENWLPELRRLEV